MSSQVTPNSSTVNYTATDATCARSAPVLGSGGCARALLSASDNSGYGGER